MSTRAGFVLGSAGYKPIVRNLNVHKESELTKVFHANDEGRKGYLSRNDLKVALVELFGFEPSKYEISEMFEKHGDKDSGINGTANSNMAEKMCLQNFILCMKQKLSMIDEDDEIRQSFMAFDGLCRGFLTLDDVKKVFNTVAPHVPSHTIHSSFREIDQDGDGRVSYKDFEFLMKYSIDDHI